MKLISGFKYIFQKLFSKKDGEYASYVLAEKVTSWIYPGYYFSEFGKYWQTDKAFKDFYEKLDGKANYHSMDRKFFLRSLLGLVDGLNGDLAECGVFQGTSSWLMCDYFRGGNKVFYGLDSFEGLSMPQAEDKNYWKEGDLSTKEEIARKNLEEFKFAKIHKGWIPEVLDQIPNTEFCFVHIDVDLYQPTLESIKYFYPRLVKGGIIVCDDYGFLSCPGARKAVDDFFSDKPEKVIEVPTGQSFIVKK